MNQHDIDFNCDRCRHKEICILFKTLTVFNQQNFPLKPIIKSVDLAKICPQYDTPFTEADVHLISEP